MHTSSGWLALSGIAAMSFALVHCVGDDPTGSLGDAGDDAATQSDTSTGGDGSVITDAGSDAGHACAAPNVTCGAGVSPCLVDLAGGGSTFCARDEDCNLYCWGNNGDGQLAADPAALGFSPTPLKIDLGGLIAFSMDVGAVSDKNSGEAVVCARVGAKIGATVTVMCWGANLYGQLGVADGGPQIDDGGNPIRSTPMFVPGLTDIAVINAGARHACAMTGGSLVDCWGDNSFGELGRTTAASFDPNPNPIVGLTPVAKPAAGAVGVGYFHTCIISASSGEVYCVGANGQEQLGNTGPSNTQSSTAFSLATGTTQIVELASSGKSTCSLDVHGTILCWGQNDEQQMGNDTAPTDQATPTSPSNLSSSAGGVQAGSAYYVANFGTLPLPDGGITPNLMAWGNDVFGQGVPTTIDGGDVATPMPVTGLPEGFVAHISAGSQATCVLMSNGSVWCWGANHLGELGNRGVGGNDDTLLPPGQVTF